MVGKACKRCGEFKPYEQYYKHKRMGDGHLGFCKECTKGRVRKHREENIERIREYDRGRPRRSYTNKEYKKSFPNRVYAQNKVGNALRDGKLKIGRAHV